VVALRRPSAAQLLVAWVIFLPGLMFAAEGLYALLLAATGANWNPNMQVAMTAADAAPVWLALMAGAVGP
ncbi:hypothetical protein ACP3W1_29870, partial [Salmonella enterica]|uniref:hypothetical protein n=1 Tax=Salmonella enterica TaxID=28901 RepID=UPI003CE722B4